MSNSKSEEESYLKKSSRFPWTNTFTAIGLILAAGAIFATYDTFRKSQTKELTIELYNSAPLVSILPEASSDITINYKGKQVRNLSLVQVTVKNSGGQPIKPEDYIEPIEFIFPSAIEIAEVYVIDSNPSSIGMTVDKVTSNIARMSTTLLNQNDQSSIAFVLISEDQEAIENINLTGRIVGVRTLEYQQRKGSENRVQILILFTASVLGVFASSISIFVERLGKRMGEIVMLKYSQQIPKRFKKD